MSSSFVACRSRRCTACMLQPLGHVRLRYLASSPLAIFPYPKASYPLPRSHILRLTGTKPVKQTRSWLQTDTILQKYNQWLETKAFNTFLSHFSTLGVIINVPYLQKVCCPKASHILRRIGNKSVKKTRSVL